MPGRMFTTQNYRYGLNGQEKDDEINGIAGAYTSAEFWEYDTRLGRRWNRDPIVKPWESSYACFNNNPIYFADPSGLDGEPKPNQKGHVYDCGDGTTETFDGEKYVGGKTNVVVILKDSRKNYDIGKMQKNNQNWKIMAADNLVDARDKLNDYKKENNIDKFKNTYIHNHGATGKVDTDDSGGELTSDDFERYDNLSNGLRSQETMLDDKKIDAIEALDDIAGMMSNKGNLFFGACFAGRQYNRNGQKMTNNLPIAMGKVILKNNNIDIFLNNDATYFTTENGQSTLNFDQPLSPLFSLFEGFTIISKSNNNTISKSMYKLQLQLNSTGEPVVPIKPPVK